MKTTRTRTLITGLFLAIVIVSCQKNDLSNRNSETTTPRAPDNGVQTETVTPTNLPDCATTCIDPAGPYIKAAGYCTKTNGGSGNWKTVSYETYNTANSLVVEVTFTQSDGHASDDIVVTVPGLDPQSITTLTSGSVHTFTFPLPAGWQACDDILFTIDQQGQGQSIAISGSYNLYALCANKGCETSFTGEAVACGTSREAVYTFTSKDALSYFKIQGGLTNFTGANAVVTVTGGSNITQDQWTPGGSTNRVIKVEGSVAECETITIRITWNSTNSGGVITGSWSVSANGGEVAPAVSGLTCN